MNSHPPRVGIDLGGTKIEIVALDSAGRETIRRRIPTPQNDYRAILQAMADLVWSVERELGRKATIGIGTPGSLSAATGLMRNSNSVCLNGQPLQRDLQSLLKREIRMANDANCFALSEALDGAGRGATIVFGVILGTGVGGGIVVSGHLLRGANAIAGEWGHNPLPSPTSDDLPLPACYCGRYGCVETYLSGPGMTCDHEQRSGKALNPGAIVATAKSGDASCERTLQLYESRLARALAVVINILDPDIIVLGGGMSNIARLYDHVPLLWRQHVFSDHVATRLAKNEHGDSSGVRGAARLLN
jgi:fructokinase